MPVCAHLRDPVQGLEGVLARSKAYGKAKNAGLAGRQVDGYGVPRTRSDLRDHRVCHRAVPVAVYFHR